MFGNGATHITKTSTRTVFGVTNFGQESPHAGHSTAHVENPLLGTIPSGMATRQQGLEATVISLPIPRLRLYQTSVLPGRVLCCKPRGGMLCCCSFLETSQFFATLLHPSSPFHALLLLACTVAAAAYITTT